MKHGKMSSRQLHQLRRDPETLAEQVEQSHLLFVKAQHLDQIRRDAAEPLAKQLTEQIQTTGATEAHFGPNLNHWNRLRKV